MVTPSKEANSTPSLEELLAHVIVEYQLVTITPSGVVLQDASTISNEMPSLRVKPLCAFETGFPLNFEEFYIDGVTPATLFPWFVRTRLRYSCSTVSFARFIVPKLKKLGLERIHSSTINQAVNTKTFEIYTALFTPRKQHALELVSWLGDRTEVVEAFFGVQCCNHNALKCHDIGIVIDLALGQFTGTMAPYVFKDEKEWIAEIPGGVIHVFKTEETDIQGQIARDCAPWRAQLSPDATPARFSKRVLKSLEMKKPHCGHCFGTASVGTVLKRCSRCQRVQYCSRKFQILHWKINKKTCQSDNV